ncbi:hypothetical protein CONPUDRAFT_143332 [Coniophora puteana RWD-64-598 SS2]|uniref:Uncharacterized protein n=1 Tax=Coniophora puteana (strain RWD-64-598) TaxID=741705 RepID=A0A5M3MWB2_CONPW|nr:uncharacterized protein CONPUDRAFT_143332 [Coniophora puteana RWD-64-598 SS2]EIW83438.1 hypothetical protein CONPUDRAFT_143332 [Coniophora puteana RWD-64-598 SS2]
MPSKFFIPANLGTASSFFGADTFKFSQLVGKEDFHHGAILLEMTMKELDTLRMMAEKSPNLFGDVDNEISRLQQMFDTLSLRRDRLSNTPRSWNILKTKRLRKSNECYGVMKLSEKDTKPVTVPVDKLPPNAPVIGIQVNHDESDASPSEITLLSGTAQVLNASSDSTSTTQIDNGGDSEQDSSTCRAEDSGLMNTGNATRDSDLDSLRTLRQSDFQTKQQAEATTPPLPVPPQAQQSPFQSGRTSPASPLSSPPIIVHQHFFGNIYGLGDSASPTAASSLSHFSINSVSGDGNVTGVSGVPFGSPGGQYNTFQMGGTYNRGTNSGPNVTPLTAEAPSPSH